MELVEFLQFFLSIWALVKNIDGHLTILDGHLGEKLMLGKQKTRQMKTNKKEN